MLRTWLFFMSALAWSRDAEARAIGGSPTVEFGNSTILPCKLPQLQNTENLEQISWQRKTKGKPQTDNFLTIKSTGVHFVNGNDQRFEFIGRFADLNGSLQLFNVNLDDEGSYTCIFSVFPTGSIKAEITLKVIVLPSISVRDDKPTLGDKDVPLATCEAAVAKPAPNVEWSTNTLKENVTQLTKLTPNPNGTFTRVTTLYGRPTKEIYGSSVECVVSSDALVEKIDFKIQVYFQPEEVRIEKTDENSFDCLTEANPQATFTWNRNGQPLPPSVSARGALLQFTSMTADLSGLYQCEATNEHGSKTNSLYVHVTVGGNVCWILFGLLLSLTLIVAAYLCFKKSETLSRFPFFSQRREQQVPTHSLEGDSPEEQLPHTQDTSN
ncbi:nectin-1 isoform X2 [Nematolebias whitei]|uniref:nectin-1 isoform X2 n=1 Tax=Nematolebias whitei TaxID=451745 RepID=UPI001896EBBC|nr:nectin-1 isoform X2 [Nematolebias whitei]